MSLENKSDPIPVSRQILYGVANWALLAAGLANLVAGTWAAFNDSAAVAATSLTAGLVLLFAATIDRFESLKGLGIEAKTRQLDQKIGQANDALQRLREMTEITGSALVDLNSKIGRWSSAPGPRESIELAERVRQIMKSLGSDESVVAAALRPWAQTLCLDMARVQTEELQKKLQVRKQELEAEREKIPKPIKADDPIFSALCTQINSIGDFQSARLSNLHLIELENFPERFMEIFDNVPQIDSVEVQTIRSAAEKFASGMRSLKQTRTLPDSELWIEVLHKARER